MRGPRDTEILFLTCDPRAVRQLVEELTDKLAELQIPAQIVQYGIMQKGLNGFIILAVQGMPETLLEKIKGDQEVGGYVLVPNEPPTAQREAQG